MEIDEHLKYTLYVLARGIDFIRILTIVSLQFDPCPRAGEPMVSRRKFPDVRLRCAPLLIMIRDT